MSQLFVPKFRVDECLEEIRTCLESGWTGLGFKTLEIEDAWKKFTGLPHAHFLSSNSVGLHLALEVLKRENNWDSSAEIISSPLTFVSTNHAVLYAGLKIRFADVDDSLCLDVKSVESQINQNTKAIIFVGIGGNTGQLEEIKQVAERHNLKLILDAAHMAGTRVNQVHVGQEADVTIFSFQAVKNLPTADSGMICFREASHDAWARKLSWLGIDKDTYSRTNSQGAYKWLYEVEELGYKYHGNSIMASLALVGLKYLDSDNSYRRQLARWYKTELQSNPNVQIIEQNPKCESSTHLFQIAVENREELLLALNNDGIFPGVHYRDNTEYSIYAEHAGLCPRARYYSQRIVSLPMHMGITHDDVLKISRSVNKYV